MQTLCLSHAQVLSILRSNCLPNKGAKVFVVAIETNWGPPVSGRFDVDYLHIWVALPDYLQIQLLCLHHLLQGRWSDSEPLKYQASVEGFHLYYLDIQGLLPNEFVVKLVTDQGTFYDNNGGCGTNYRLVPHQGRGATAIVGEHGHICVFPTIAKYSLIDSH